MANAVRAKTGRVRRLKTYAKKITAAGARHRIRQSAKAGFPDIVTHGSRRNIGIGMFRKHIKLGKKFF